MYVYIFQSIETTKKKIATIKQCPKITPGSVLVHILPVSVVDILFINFDQQKFFKFYKVNLKFFSLLLLLYLPEIIFFYLFVCIFSQCEKAISVSVVFNT